MKKTIAIIMTVVMIAGMAALMLMPASAAWDGTAVATGFESGTGTEADPFVIKTAEQLAYLSAQVKAKESYEGKYFVLAANIDLGKNAWTPIGIYYGSSSEDNTLFKGSFDGKGYTVSGIKVECQEDDKNNGVYAGLFGDVETTGYIKNIVIADSAIESKKSYAGALVGCMTGGVLEGIVINNDVTVSGVASLGGVAGRIVDCDAKYLVNNAKLTVSGDSNSSYVGGITGVIGGNASVSYAVNNGAIEGDGAFIGGIAGITGGNSGGGNIYNSYNTATLTYKGTKGRYVGGIAGRLAHSNNQSYKTENCYNLGTVSAPNAASANLGEIAGHLRYAATSLVNLYSVDLTDGELIGKVENNTLPDTVTVKTENEIKVLSAAIDAKIEENKVTPPKDQLAETTTVADVTTAEPSNTTNPGETTASPAETTGSQAETTAKPATTTKPTTPPSTGDGTTTIVIVAIVALAAVLVVTLTKKRER